MNWHRITLLALLILTNPTSVLAQAAKVGQGSATYYPDAVWQQKRPADVGMNPQSVKDAMDAIGASNT